MLKKDRLDTLLAEKGLFSSRERAKAAIMAGIVWVNGERIDKVGTQVDRAAQIEVRGSDLKYVSRGGLKLEKGLKTFNINLYKKTTLDIGASTGGFTDCVLQQGGTKVYAVDVGYGQLDWRLRQDKRVVVLERTNARYLTLQDIPEPIDFISIDVSFISLTKILPVAQQFLTYEGSILALIKPQFEAGRSQVGKKGVVRDPLIHGEVIHNIMEASLEKSLYSWGLTYSPITGPEGNIEYLIWLKQTPPVLHESKIQVQKIVSEAFVALKGKS